MKWTNDLPEQDGWYFERRRINGKSYVCVKHVSRDQRGRLWAGAMPFSHGASVKAGDGAQWAGPISEPKEEA